MLESTFSLTGPHVCLPGYSTVDVAVKKSATTLLSGKPVK